MAGGVTGGPALAAKSWPRWLLFCLRLSLGIPALVHASCPRPESSADMVLTGEALLKNDFPEGSTATFECSIGYQRASGQPDISCTGGKWTEVTLKCQKKSCGSPGEVQNGRFDFTEGIEFGAIVKAICNEGYEIVGQDYRQCLNQGWTGRIPTCEVVHCNEPPEIPNGKIVSRPSSEFPQYRDTIEYKCNAGYTLVGDMHIMCNANGKYEPQAPECRDIICETPQVPNSHRVGGALPPFKLDNFVKFACDNGYEMDGRAEMTCTVNGWSNTPTCKPVTPIFTPPGPTKGPNDDRNFTENKIPWETILIVLAVLFAAAAVIACCWVYWFRKKKGDYYTREEDPKATTTY